MHKSILAFLIAVVLTIAAGSAAAQADSDGCFPHSVAVVQVITRIRASNGFDSPVVAGARPGDTFEIMSASGSADDCWIRVSAGWLYGDTVSADPVDTATTAPAATLAATLTATPIATAQPGCYTDRIAYVSGTMNIRRSPSASGGRVRQAQAGDVYVVTESAQGDTYCWVQVEDGWMAQTGRLRGALPASALPRIEGDAAFVENIQSGLDYLKVEALEWYLYVVKPSYTIRPAPPGETTTYIYPEQRRMDVLERHLTPLINLASVMAHEVCHLYQHERGIRVRLWDEEGRVRVEKECIQVQIDLITAIEPDHWTIPQYEAQLAINRGVSEANMDDMCSGPAAAVFYEVLE